MEFKTDTRYPAAEVTLYYDQTFLSYDDIDLAKSTIALLLSLDGSRVIQTTANTKTQPNTDVSPSSQTRRLNTIKSSATFIIIDVDNSEVYPRPLDLITILATKINKLERILTNFDSGTEVIGVEIYMDQCKFSVYPSIVQVFNRNATVNAALVEDGSVYAVLTNFDLQPFAFQVYLGLDATNKPVSSYNSTVLAGNSVNLTFENLLPNTEYIIYLICSNDYPGYPDLLNDANLVKLVWNTLPDPPFPSLQINFSALICGMIVYYYILL